MMVPAVVARRFVPLLHSPHIERQRCDGWEKERQKKKKTKVGIRKAKNSGRKTRLKLADIEKQI